MIMGSFVVTKRSMLISSNIYRFLYSFSASLSLPIVIWILLTRKLRSLWEFELYEYVDSRRIPGASSKSSIVKWVKYL
jgi:hypothetical protein